MSSLNMAAWTWLLSEQKIDILLQSFLRFAAPEHLMLRVEPFY